MSYLTTLALRLTGGILRLTEELRRRHGGFVAERQASDGGFPGRQGRSDLYYTGFALRALTLTESLTPDIAHGAAGFLRARSLDELPPIDLLSLVTCDVLLEAAGEESVFGSAERRQTEVERLLAPLRRDDGGYAKSPRSTFGSTYHTFLVAGCRQLVGLPLDDARQIARFLDSRRRADGGFVELPQIRQAGTNPTAAAVGLLRLSDALDGPTREAAARFLAGMQTVEGGLRANSRVPVADLLSTFTGMVALGDLAADASIDPSAARRYAESLDRPTGGFLGGFWDDAADVEYTFYGLGTLALLAPKG